MKRVVWLPELPREMLEAHKLAVCSVYGHPQHGRADGLVTVVMAVVPGLVFGHFVVRVDVEPVVLHDTRDERQPTFLVRSPHLPTPLLSISFSPSMLQTFLLLSLFFGLR